MKIIIIGSGWFGNYLAYKISQKFEVKIFEKNNDIMQEAAKWNQRRLHMGFHYPRSYDTIYQTVEGYSLFKNEFPFFSNKIQNNLYGVAESSLVSSDSYINIYKKLKIPFDILSKNDKKKFGLKNIDAVIRVNEEEINYYAAYNFFKKVNQKITTLNCKVNEINLSKNIISTDLGIYHFDFLINTSYIDNNIKVDQNYNEIPLKYEICAVPIYKNMSSSSIYNSFSYTVMDGDFCSLYQFDQELFSLTSVQHTPLIRMDKRDFQEFMKLDMKSRAELSESVFIKNGSQDIFEKILYNYISADKLSIKFIANNLVTKVKYHDDDNDRRDTKISFNNRYIIVYPGKIDSIHSSYGHISKYIIS